MLRTVSLILLLAMTGTDPARGEHCEVDGLVLGCSNMPSHTFRSPASAAVGRDGRLYVADTGNHRIVVFSSNGTFLSTWPTAGPPEAIAVSPDRAYVLLSSSIIVPYRLDGSSMASWGGIGQTPRHFAVRGIDIAADSFHVYATDAEGSVIQFDHGGGLIRRWRSRDVRGIAVDDSGFIYLTEHTTHAPLRTTRATPRPARFK